MKNVKLEELTEWEQSFFDAYKEIIDCYNCGEFVDSPSRGTKRSEKHKDAIRKSKLGVPKSDETKQKLRDANLGKVVPEEVRAKQRANTMKIRGPHSEERKQKLSDANAPKNLKQIYSPEGELFEFYSTNKFCKEHNLSRTRIMEVLAKRATGYKGWSLEVDFNFKPRYIATQLVSPLGEIYELKNSIHFGEEHNLDRKKVSLLAKGQIDNYKGWTAAIQSDVQ